MQNVLNIHNNAGLMGGEIRLRPFAEVLREVQEHITKNYADQLKDDPEHSRALISSYIRKYLEERQLGVAGTEPDELSELLYGEMTGFSFLSKYLYRDDVEEVNINQWDDVKVIYANGEVLPTKESFTSPRHALDVIKRMLHKSGMILDNAKPYVIGHLSNKIRITATSPGIVDEDKGLSVSIRIVNPRKLKKEEFVNYGTATAEMLDLLSVFFNYGVSMCMTGATSSGKTTLMSWILDQIPNDKRLITIEKGCREFDSVKRDQLGRVLNNVIHFITKESDDPKQVVSMVKLLELALTMHPDFLVVAEMKSEESLQAIKAANTGHTSLTTIHANGCEDTYYRMAALCKESSAMDDATLMGLATRGFPIVAFAKKLEDNSRRLMEIAECVGVKSGAPVMRTLYRFNITDNCMENGKAKIIGYYEKVNGPSDGLCKRLRENGMPLTLQQRLLIA
ncbi:MAG TPA: ATPase, T2SS/T4P/T4SS family [Clostridia bacterium]|nr:ATPase, T2SS/T4P/T4SS family [Clostridia bacterium]